MKKITYRLIFNRKNKLNKEGEGLIQIECYLNRKRKYISTGIKVEPIYWNSKLNIIKNNHPESIELNKLINKQVRVIEDFEFRKLEENGTFSLEEITGFSYDQKETEKSFLDFFRKNIESNKAISKKTKSHHKVVLKKLEDFRRNILFSDINYDLVKSFDDYLRSRTSLHVNSIANHHKTVKAYINLAINKGILSIDKYPYRQFKVKKIKTEREFLNKEEVAKIADIEFTESGKKIEFVRDMYLFSCYTGLRYSDVQTLQSKHIYIDEKGYNIKKRMEKTDTTVFLPISELFNGKAVTILKKYMQEGQENKVFKKLSNQEANIRLKVVAAIAVIDKDLSFHSSRHTFGTSLAAIFEDPFIIKELMGHTDIKTSMVYIHMTKNVLINKLKRGNWD